LRDRIGRKAAMAGASTNPTPGALAMIALPPAITSISPGTPMRDDVSNESGSRNFVSIRRHSASIRFRPSIVRTNN
jgi:hypothetical protein